MQDKTRCQYPSDHCRSSSAQSANLVNYESKSREYASAAAISATGSSKTGTLGTRGLREPGATDFLSARVVSTIACITSRPTDPSAFFTRAFCSTSFDSVLREWEARYQHGCTHVSPNVTSYTCVADYVRCTKGPDLKVHFPIWICMVWVTVEHSLAERAWGKGCKRAYLSSERSCCAPEGPRVGMSERVAMWVSV